MLRESGWIRLLTSAAKAAVAAAVMAAEAAAAAQGKVPEAAARITVSSE
jgi:hypothetical protein